MKHRSVGLACLFILYTVLRSAEPLALPRVVIGADAVDLQEWLILGKFNEQSDIPAIEVDFLERWGGAEGKGSAAELLQLGERLNATSDGPTARSASGVSLLNLRRFYGHSIRPAMPNFVAYTACEIVSSQDREAWLLFGSNDAARIWFNGALCHDNREPRRSGEVHDAVMLPLKQGRNLLIVKIGNLGVMTARLELDSASGARAALGNSTSLLRHPIISEGGSVELAFGGVPTSVPVEVRIERHNGSLIRSIGPWSRTPIGVAGLSRGLYRLNLNLIGEQLILPFYIGTLSDLSVEMVHACVPYSGDNRIKLNLDTLLRRLEILKKAGGAGSSTVAERQDIEHKAIYAAVGIASALERLESGEEPFRHRPGLHLRAFRSQIDDQPMHYRLFVPEGYNLERGLPLVIRMSPVFEVERPFIESVFVAQHRFAEERGRHAEKLGIGVLWPGYRLRPYGNPADFAHIDEVLAAVAADYRIDRSRIYLLGVCSSGLTAAMELARQPDRYAAVALQSPVLHRLKGRYDERLDFKTNMTYRSWLRETDPLMRAAEVRNVPVWILHDQRGPDHGPLSHSVEYIEWSRAMGNRPRFDKRKLAASRSMVTDEQIEWLASQRKQTASEFVTEHGVDGMGIASALAERFVVVRGTTGSESEKTAASRWYHDFQDAWQRTNYGPCRVVDDIRLTEDEERSSNLVLIGNPQTNAVWKRLEAQLNAAVANDHVRVGDQTWSGKSLALQALCPHPSENGRKVVLIGAADLMDASVGTMELALDGWFDVAVWRGDSGAPDLLATVRKQIER